MFTHGHQPRPHLTSAAKARAVAQWLATRGQLAPAQAIVAASRHGRPYLPIDRAVPMPQRKGPAFARPFAHMEVGDSFFEPLRGLSVKTVAQRIRWDAKHYAPARFDIVEMTQGGTPGLRVWRVA